MKRHLPRLRELRPFSTELRNHATPEERHLWYDYLSKYPVHFYRQRIIGPYIVDFYCPKAKLVVELDGSQHRTPEGLWYDAHRTAFLERYGLRVVRFRNWDVKTRFTAVCRRIDAAVRERAEAE
ncbi:MAG: endonuclease domain-containing protein [Clostridia bacterium]|nr:endonuclease domain-containing protein [Clostridia bacterium]